MLNMYHQGKNQKKSYLIYSEQKKLNSWKLFVMRDFSFDHIPLESLFLTSSIQDWVLNDLFGLLDFSLKRS